MSTYRWYTGIDNTHISAPGPRTDNYYYVDKHGVKKIKEGTYDCIFERKSCAADHDFG